ncbi:unnamed protein product [Effrenium voratum]|nr:unnamed protein product [Effrenium voratum]
MKRGQERVACDWSDLRARENRSLEPRSPMPVWQNVNLKQKAIFEIIQREDARNLPYYLQDEELDFFIRGIACGPHAKTYLPQLVEREKRPIYIARGYAPPSYSRVVKIRFYGPDPLMKDAGPSWPGGSEGELMEYIIGWRWLYAYWDGPLVDEAMDLADVRFVDGKNS